MEISKKAVTYVKTISLFPYIFVFSACRGVCPRNHPLGELVGQGVGLMLPLFYCFRVCLMLLLHGFVAKQACLVLWLNKSTFFFLNWSIIALECCVSFCCTAV